MQPETLLVLDFDRTLCETPSAAGRGLAYWLTLIEETDPEPVEGAVTGVSFFLKEADDVLVLTGRSSDQLTLTAEWLWRWFPMLRNVPLSMRPREEPPTVRSHVSKSQRLNELRGDRRVLLIDDDFAMVGSLQETDLFYLAPRLWTSPPCFSALEGASR